MRKAHPLAAAGIAIATAAVVVVEASFGGQFRLLSGVFPQPPLPISHLRAPAGPAGGLDPGRRILGPDAAAPDSRSATPARPACRLGAKLVPTCNVLWGVAPGAQTKIDQRYALHKFEADTGRGQAIYHAYHRGLQQMFPTPPEIAMAREPGHQRLLMINWRPNAGTWAAVARGDRRVDNFLDRLASHLRTDFRERFILAIHHEPENDVRVWPGSGYTALDYRAMYRHIVFRLRAHGAGNVVTAMVFMAYAPWNVKPWWSQLYPGNDVVDWIAWDTYAYSNPGYGYGDFAQMVNRTTRFAKSWPGMYTWAARHFPAKPFMIAEWGVFQSRMNPRHPVDFLATVAAQLRRFPQIKALCYFDTPNAHGHDTRVTATPDLLAKYRWLGAQPTFQVSLAPLA
ncbi:MAG: hypothetical protein V7603_2826 [Micromonosporaceae bacterium]